METTVELVTTKTYTADDLAQLLGEGKGDVTIAVKASGDRGNWSHPMSGGEKLLRVIIREPAEFYDVDKDGKAIKDVKK